MELYDQQRTRENLDVLMQFSEKVRALFAEQKEAGKLMLAVVIAASGCAVRTPGLPAEAMLTSTAVVSAEFPEAVSSEKPLPPENKGQVVTAASELPLDFNIEHAELFKIIQELTDDELAQAFVTRQELSRAIDQLKHLFIRQKADDPVLPAIGIDLFRNGISYTYKWADSVPRPFTDNDARETLEDAISEVRERTANLIPIRKSESDRDSNVSFSFRGFIALGRYDADEARWIGGVTHAGYKHKKVALLADYFENYGRVIDFNLDKDLSHPKTNNLVLINNTKDGFSGISALPVDVQRMSYKAYFKKAIVHELIHRMLGYTRHNDEIPTSIMNKVAHILITLTEEEGPNGKILKASTATDMEDPNDPVNTLLRVIWAVLKKAGALEKNSVPLEVKN